VEGHCVVHLMIVEPQDSDCPLGDVQQAVLPWVQSEELSIVLTVYWALRPELGQVAQLLELEQTQRPEVQWA
jgi:hypothetical protein